MSEFFETSFGDRIAVAPEVEKALYPSSNREERLKKALDELYISDRFLKKNIVNKIGITEIGSDLNTYTLAIDFLEELRLLEKDFGTALDIAGGEGVHAALFRGNYAREVDVADVEDGSNPHLTRNLKKALWKFRRYKLEESISRGGLFGHRVPRIRNHKHLNIPSAKNYYNFGFKRKPTVDNFIIGDWREKVTKQYDFIMNFMSFWLWDHTESFPKIASSLNAGGIFVALAPYSWTGRPTGDGGGLLGGGFPFFEQRLTIKDIVRYYEQYKPELAKYVEDYYHCFDPHRPTINDYSNCAMENGLAVLGTKRLYNNDLKYALTYREHFGERIVAHAACESGIVADAGEILNNIGRFRTDITFEDLLTRGVVMVFQKPA